MANNAQTNLDVIVRGVDELSPQLQKIESKVIRVVGAVGASLAALRLISFPVTASAAFERQMANVTKTTNFTREQIKGLSEDILKLSLTLDVSAEDLAKVAAAGGQQGLGREGVKGILQFTEAVSRMASVLDLEAGDAANQIGKIANIFKIPFDKLEAAVASFNQTSNNTTASGEDLLNVVRRLGDASGTLNLQQAIGLSASALDFGVSPEVAGTSLSKIFSAMLQKADQFTKLINQSTDGIGKHAVISVKEWANTVSSDGIEGFKQALAGLRKLDKNAQQTAIVKLFGGGRIGSLVTKYVQDSNNAVLDRDLGQSVSGYAQGISALREQATVLNTLSAQATILKNSIQKDAIEAGNQLTGQLITDVRSLSASLQDPGVRSFINEVVASLGDLLSVVVNTAKFLSGLNINWENFVRVAKVFVELKLATYLGSLFSSVTGITAGMQKLATNAKAASAATKGAADAGKLADTTAAIDGQATAWQKTKAVYNELSSMRKAEQAAIAKEIELNKQLALQREKVDSADRRVTIGSDRALSGRYSVDKISAKTSTAQTTVSTTQDAQAAAASSIYATYNAKIEAAELAHQARLTEIEVEYQAKREAAKALGRNVAGKAALAEADAFLEASIATENKYYSKSVTGTRTYYEQKLSTSVASYDAELVAQQAYLDKMVERELTARGALNVRIAELDAAKVDKATASGEVQATAGALGAVVAGPLAKGPGLVAKLGLAITGLRFGLQALARVAMGAFFWVTIIYSLADAFGLIDKLGGLFTTLGEAIGFTSAAEKKLAVARDEAAAAHTAEIARLDEEIAKYEKLKDAKTNAYSKDLAQAAANRAGHDADATGRASAFDELITAGTGALSQQKKTQDVTDPGLNKADLAQATQDRAKTQAELADARANLADLEQKLAATQASIANGLPAKVATEMRGLASLQASMIAQQKSSIDDLNAKLDEQTQTYNFAAGVIDGKYTAALETSTASAKEAAGALATVFTEQSASIATESLGKIAEALDVQEKATEAFKKANDAQIGIMGKEGSTLQEKAEAAAAVAKASDAVTKASLEVNTLRTALAAQVQALVNSGTITSDQGKKALEDLNTIALKTAQQIRNVLALLGLAKAQGDAFTGANAGVFAAPPTSGTGTAPAGKGEESEASRVAKARVKLENARIEAETSIRKEGNDQLLSADERAYNQGLIALKRYYDDRQRIQLQISTDEIAARQRELDEVTKAEAESTKESERLQYEAQSVKLKGDIAVLQKHRDEIVADNQEALRQAREAFDTRVLSETNKAYQSLTLPAGLKTQFQTGLDEQLANYKVFLAQLETEAKAALARGDKDAAARLVQLKQAITEGLRAESFDQALQSSQKQLGVSMTAIEQYQRSLNVLRGEGAMTSMESEAAYNQAIQAQIPLLEEQLKAQEALLASQTQGTLIYQQQALAVNETRLQIAELGAQANATAKEINANLASSFADALGKLQPTMKSLKDTVIGFIHDIADNMKQTLAKSISESVMGATGNTGAGGLGGFFQKILQNGSDTKGASAPTTALGQGAASTSGGVLGQLAGIGKPDGSLTNPIYTRDAGDGLGGLGSLLGGSKKDDNANAGLETALGTIFSTNTDRQISATTTTQQTTSGQIVAGVGEVGQAVGGGFGNLLSLIATAVSSLISAIFTSSASSSASSGAASAGGGSWAGLGSALGSYAATAHTGGVIGSTNLRGKRVGAAAFANANRYHTGGVVGLGPDEVPIVAKKGEEVVTANDPRHRNNGGGAGGGAPVQMSQTLVFDTQAAAKAILTGDNLMTAIRPNVKAMRQVLGVKD